MEKLLEQIIYKDESIIAVNKSSGLLTIPDGYNPNIINLKTELDHLYGRVWTVHRLDKETSGVIIFARTQTAHHLLNEQFANHQIIKEYIAITHNIPDWIEFELEIPLKINGDRNHRTIVANTGKISKSSFSMEIQNDSLNISKINVFPHSGYTHQIRCHLSYLGLPIIGDLLYTRKVTAHQKLVNDQFGRLMLHASMIKFIHPETKNFIEIIVPPSIAFDLN